MTMSKTRGKKRAEEDWKKILEFLAEENGGKSQNQIYTKFKEDISWVTIRRDLARLVERDFLKVQKGKRGAKLHSLTFMGLITYLASIHKPFPRSYISEPDEGLEQFKKRVKAERTKSRDYLKKLVGVIERKGRRLNVPIFEECRSLYDNLGISAVEEILDLTLAMGLRPPIPSLSTHIQTMEERKKELMRKLERPRHARFFSAARIRRGEEEKVIEVDPRKHLEEEIKGLNVMIDAARSARERLWRQSFVESFFTRVTYLARAKKLDKMPNERLYKQAKEILDKKREMLEALESAVDLFEAKACFS